MPANLRVSAVLVSKMQALCKLALDEGGIEVTVANKAECYKLRQQIYSVRKHLHRHDAADTSPVSVVEMSIKVDQAAVAAAEKGIELKTLPHKLCITPLGASYQTFNIHNSAGQKLSLTPTIEELAEAGREYYGPSEKDIADIKAEIEANYTGKLPTDVAAYEKLDAQWEADARARAAQGYRVHKPNKETT